MYDKWSEVEQWHAQMSLFSSYGGDEDDDISAGVPSNGNPVQSGKSSGESRLPKGAVHLECSGRTDERMRRSRRQKLARLVATSDRKLNVLQSLRRLAKLPKMDANLPLATWL